MQPTKTRYEKYENFLNFVQQINRKEARVVNRQMLHVFFWCFLLPVLITLIVLILVQFGLLPYFFRAYLDWVILIFPVFYAFYFLGAEVLGDLPLFLRRGGASMVLRQSLKESKWRKDTFDDLHGKLNFTTDDWLWVIHSFEIDLRRMRERIRFLTGLAGAVFYLLMQGLDSLSGDSGAPVSWIRDGNRKWVEVASYDIGQFMGLGLFLLLLYLSGMQAARNLERYKDCVDLLIIKDIKSTGEVPDVIKVADKK